MAGAGVRMRGAAATAALLLVAALVTSCAPAPRTFTAGEREELCSRLQDAVALETASEVHAAVYMFRAFGPSLPSDQPLPNPDCAYLARAEYSDRLEVFYFGDDPDFAQSIIDRLPDWGWTEQEGRWLLFEFDVQPISVLKVWQFYSAEDAPSEARQYAQLIGQPAVIISVTTRHVD